MNAKITISSIAGVVASIILSGCGGSGTSSNDSTTSATYNGAGSRWILSINGGEATIKELNDNIQLTTEVTNLDNGFIKFQVITSNRTDIPVGSVTYGFELPNFMLPFVAFNEQLLIPTIINTGSCPTNLNHNYIISYARATTYTDGSIGDFTNWGIYGYWIYDPNTNTTNYNTYDSDGTYLSNNSGSFPGSITSYCQNGAYYDPDGDPTDDYRAETTAFFSTNGGIIWNQRGLGNVVGTEINDRQENDFFIPVEPNLNSIDQIDGTYIGYAVYGNGRDLGFTNVPILLEANNGSMTIQKFTDIENNQIDQNNFATMNLDQPLSGTKGIWTGTITINGIDGNTYPLGCAIKLETGATRKNIIICSTKIDNDRQLFSLILAEQ